MYNACHRPQLVFVVAILALQVLRSEEETFRPEDFRCSCHAIPSLRVNVDKPTDVHSVGSHRSAAMSSCVTKIEVHVFKANADRHARARPDASICTRSEHMEMNKTLHNIGEAKVLKH